VKPIIFNTEEVQATLNGSKTVTRRVVKTQKKILENPKFGHTTFTPDGHVSVRGGWIDAEGEKRYGENFIKPPYQPGDMLYVRETFVEYRGHFYYKADGKYEALSKLGIQFKWRPSKHMPKEAARIFLGVTDVRVERLQDITDDGVEKEGIPIIGRTEKEARCLQAFSRYRKIWDNTIKPKDRALYGWEANPWVWVIEFERISKDEAET